MIKIGNKLTCGDELELIIPGKIEPQVFKIERMWDDETGEPIDFVNPGKLGQSAYIDMPIYAEPGWLLRRKK